MKSRMSCREYEAWKALYGVFPFGEHGLDARLAMLTSVTASGLFAGKVKGQFGPEKFSAIRRRRPKPKPQTPEEMQAVLGAAARRQPRSKPAPGPRCEKTI